MSVDATLLLLTTGAAALALWIDVRWPVVTGSLRAACVHTAVAVLALMLVGPAAESFAAAPVSRERMTAVMLLIVLPGLVYAFYAALRLLRVLAGLWAFR